MNTDRRNTQSTALALRGDAPLAFGTRDEIQSIAERIRVMLPSAHLSDYQMKRADRAQLQKVLDESIYRAAQLSVFYRLVPGEDVHVIPFGNNWAVDMGIETWKKAADRYCAQHGITYHIHTETMSDEELRARRGEQYDPKDVGVVAYLWRSDKAEVYQIFGAKESMTRACGVWAVKAKQVQGEWKADQIPTQRSKQDVAKRRAMKAVLKLEFSLDSLLAATPAEVRSNLDALNMTVRAEERRTALPASRRAEIDEDGFVVVEPTPARRNTQDIEFVVVDSESIDENAPDVDEIEAPGEAQDDVQDKDPYAVDYRALAAKLQGLQGKFVDWARQAHADSHGPASKEQYRYLVGILNTITGDKESHRLILGVMTGRHTDSDNTPGVKLAGKLIEWLAETTKDEVTGEKIANPTFRQDYAECVRGIVSALK
jgi:hypothetical protein